MVNKLKRNVHTSWNLLTFDILKLVILKYMIKRNSALAKGLAAHGHNVTVLSPDKDENVSRGVHYILLEGLYSKQNYDILKTWFKLKNQMSPLTSPNIVNEYWYDVCKGI